MFWIRIRVKTNTDPKNGMEEWNNDVWMPKSCNLKNSTSGKTRQNYQTEILSQSSEYNQKIPVIHILIPSHSSVGTGYHRTVPYYRYRCTGCRFCRSPCKKSSTMAEPTQEPTEFRSFPKSLPKFGLSRKAYHSSASSQKLAECQRARRISA